MSRLTKYLRNTTFVVGNRNRKTSSDSMKQWFSLLLYYVTLAFLPRSVALMKSNCQLSGEREYINI